MAAPRCGIDRTKQYAERVGGHYSEHMSLPALKRQVKQLGYRMKFSFNYKNNHNPPDCWDASHFETIDVGTGKHFSHYQGRRDARFDALQKLRKNAFVLHRGRIVEF